MSVTSLYGEGLTYEGLRGAVGAFAGHLEEGAEEHHNVDEIARTADPWRGTHDVDRDRRDPEEQGEGQHLGAVRDIAAINDDPEYVCGLPVISAFPTQSTVEGC